MRFERCLDAMLDLRNASARDGYEHLSQERIRSQGARPAIAQPRPTARTATVAVAKRPSCAAGWAQRRATEWEPAA